MNGNLYFRILCLRLYRRNEEDYRLGSALVLAVVTNEKRMLFP